MEQPNAQLQVAKSQQRATDRVRPACGITHRSARLLSPPGLWRRRFWRLRLGRLGPPGRNDRRIGAVFDRTRGPNRRRIAGRTTRLVT